MKSKVDCEKRCLSNEWCKKYFVIQHKESIICLIYKNTIALMKEYNMKRYYCTKHASKFDSIDGQLHFDKIGQLKKSLSMQKVFHAYEKDTELITKWK